MPLRERLRRSYRRILAKDTPENDSYLVTIGGYRLKRIVFRSVNRAETVADIVRYFDDPVVFPRLIDHYGNELWVEFVDGKPVSGNEPNLAVEIASFLSKLYAEQPRRVQDVKANFHKDLLADLDFLRNAKVLDEERYIELSRFADSKKPAEIWFGYDYTDLLLKNLVRRRDGGLCVIDIASLHSDSLLGLGLIKLLDQRWLKKEVLRETVLKTLRVSGAPPVTDYLNYLELYYLASRSRRVLLREQTHKLQPEKFDALLRHRP